jgi:hypothetical protein
MPHPAPARFILAWVQRERWRKLRFAGRRVQLRCLRTCLRIRCCTSRSLDEIIPPPGRRVRVAVLRLTRDGELERRLRVSGDTPRVASSQSQLVRTLLLPPRQSPSLFPIACQAYPSVPLMSTLSRGPEVLSCSTIRPPRQLHLYLQRRLRVGPHSNLPLLKPTQCFYGVILKFSECRHAARKSNARK